MLSESLIRTILEDESKRIARDLAWSTSAEHPTWVGFSADVASTAGYPLFVNASLNAIAGKLAFALVHREEGRIYGLCLGTAHSDPEHGPTGEKHKHRWSERFVDKSSYVPEDITAPVSEANSVWQQFCREAKITHDGVLGAAPMQQMELS